MRIDPASPVCDVNLEPGPLAGEDGNGSHNTGTIRPADLNDGHATGNTTPADLDDGHVTGNTRPADLNDATSAGRPQLTVVIATRPGEHDAAGLVERLGPRMAPLNAEIIVVACGGDLDLDALAFSARTCPVPVRLLALPRADGRADRTAGILAGARHARGAWVLVMNAGEHHPVGAAAILASTAMRDACDIVVGTRFAGSTSAQGRPDVRTLAALAATLVRSMFPRRLAVVSDPLSGLFMFRTAAVDVGRLSPAAFRILLEILVRNPSTRVTEVAYRPAPQRAAQSGRALRKAAALLRHLVTLRLTRLARQLRERPTTPRSRLSQLVRMIGFGMIGASGLVVNTAVLWLCYGILGWNDLLSAALATQASTAWNFVLVDTLVYRRRSGGSRSRRAISFVLMNNLLMLARLPVLEGLVRAGTTVPAGNIITLTALFLVRFVVSDRAIFGPADIPAEVTAGVPANGPARDPVRVLLDTGRAEVTAGPGAARHAAAAPAGRKRSRYLDYRYDVAGVVTIGSQIMLPELEFFRAQWVPDRDVDIAVRVGDVGGRTPRRRAAMTEYADPTVIRYEEHLGRLGANFRARLGDRISVEVGPLLARSEHVVYTNIVEPLLRFAMAAKGRMLLHSACVEIAGVGVMLSALTDTGKTGTVLRLLREHGGRFLSDDMTVIDAAGNAWCFPKPLTISAHTLRAVRANDLTRGEWRRLQVQSRLHSKGGRSIGITLSRFNLPIMGINALTQMLVPPPKYSVDRLVPCRIASTTQVRELFVIERGAPRLAGLDRRGALEQLIVNTDDAYGFPPFRYLAPAITVGGLDYQQLRLTEREILSQFLGHVRVRTLASDTFGWADEIPRLITPDAGSSAGVGGAAGGPAPAGAWPRWDEPAMPGSYA
jgi:dolichol-phosphate mannosyltransferase